MVEIPRQSSSLAMGSVEELFSALFGSIDTFPLSVYQQLLEIAQTEVSLAYGSEQLVERFSRSLQHRSALSADRRSRPIDLQIQVFDESTLPLCAAGLARVAEYVAEREIATSASHVHCFVLHDSSGILAIEYGDTVERVEFLSANGQRALSWHRYARSLQAIHFYTSPFRAIFAWYFSRKACFLVHGAAIAGPRGAALFVGPGGTGKSSTALSMLSSETRFLGDDSVLLCDGEAPTIESMFASARLFEHDLQRLPALASVERLWAPQGEGEALHTIDQKAQLYFCPSHGQLVQNEASLQVAVVLNRGTQGAPIERIGFLEGLRHLGPNSLLHIPGVGQEYLSGVARIARMIPWVRMQVSLDAEQNLNLFNELFDFIEIREAI